MCGVQTETIANTGSYGSCCPRAAIDPAGNVAVAWEQKPTAATKVVAVALRSVSSGWLPVDTMPSGSGGVEWKPDVALRERERWFSRGRR